MINVENIYQGMRDLTTKGKGGYADSDEFNKNSKRAEQLLWQYYFSIFEQTQRVPDAMFPFLKDGTNAIDSNGQFPLPADYGHFVYVQYATVQNSPTLGNPPVITPYRARYLEKVEIMSTLESAIRKPDFAKKLIYYSFAPASKVQVYPTLSGLGKYQYLRLPVYAVRGWTLDGTNDEQDYDSTTSTNYEWQPQEESNIMDLLLLFQGITSRDTQLIQWATQHQQITPAIVH